MNFNNLFINHHLLGQQWTLISFVIPFLNRRFYEQEQKFAQSFVGG